ncbi:MAG: hypothetical protein QM736_18650 [Vicinamibacterales bacterium]
MQELALAPATNESSVRSKRAAARARAVYKRIDTCAAEFESFTPYMYGTFEHELRVEPERPPRRSSSSAAGPNRIGQGDRVRLLLLSRRLRLPRGRPRDGDGELQPRNGVDRLRHRRSPVLRAAHVRGRDGRHRAGAQRRRRASRAWCSSAARRR